MCRVQYERLEAGNGTFDRLRNWIGIVDESLKVLLPTREFDVTDLFRDFIGVAVAVGIFAITKKIGG